MNPEVESPEQLLSPDSRSVAAELAQDNCLSPTFAPIPNEPAETRFLKWALFGSRGLRVGWSVTLFLVLFFLFVAILSLVAGLLWPKFLDAKPTELTAGTAIV